MKIVELLNKINVPITNEEAEVLAKFEDEQVIQRQDLSPRETILANQLVIKDILHRKHENGRTAYKKKA